MSGASAVAARRTTRGDIEIPASVVENLSLLTDAELRFSLVVCRRGGIQTYKGAGSSVTVSDRNWQKWTGLSSRSKEYAIAGLRKKGLRMDGRGDTAKFYIERPQWEGFVRSSPVNHVRTEGRKTGVTPKAGAKVHTECRERGCALLAGSGGHGLSLVSATPNAQPVAQATCGDVQPSGMNENPAKPINLIPATRIAQPVAQTADVVEQVWAKTLAALRDYFPLVGLAFLVRLLAVVRVLFADVQDGELAKAVVLAWDEKNPRRAGKPIQLLEGLFLLTVPEAMRVLRKRPPETPPKDAGRDMREGVAALLRRAVETLRARGAPFAEHAGVVNAILLKVSETADLEDIEQQMEIADSRICETALAVLDAGQRENMAEELERNVARYGAKMTRPQLEALKDQLRPRLALEALGLTRLSTFYV